MAKKKVVKKKVVKKVSPDRVFNIDIFKYFTTGSKEISMERDYELIVEGNKLIFEKDQETILAVKDKRGNFAVNGDDLEYDMDRDEEIEKLQNLDNSITTSFEVLNQADIVLSDFEIVDIAKDLYISLKPKDKGFKDLEKNVPQGATLSVYRNYIKKTNSHSGKVYLKKVHRAGSMLVKYKGVSYICGMDDESYFCSKLKGKPKTVDAAFKSLKPRRVLDWEKKANKTATRQGEWFFIPTDVKMDSNKVLEEEPLPLKTPDSNAHDAKYYQKIKGRHYVKENIHHEEHGYTYLKPMTQVHEAIENLAKGSWSVTGVD